MIYTVGEMAQKLGVPASTLRYYDKEGLLPALWSVPPAAFGCSGKPTSNGCRSSAAGCSGAAAKWRKGNAYILGGENLLTGCAYKRRWAYYCKDLGMVQSGCFLRHFYDILKK